MSIEKKEQQTIKNGQYISTIRIKFCMCIDNDNMHECLDQLRASSRGNTYETSVIHLK